ncbi:hypothetical protein H7X46_01055 [Pseudonocardia sp. C8]|uniref:hypothetical protein n=1 Tax=Pseudonocardia sp. C8 TaxID=2762759 RepID=UPI00164291D0|nr:hypothetical protein [Pseudonocardia sp. C8]MBC3189655.1 hypothetical protein [Pseudonocardia sp. C8]
MIRALRAVAAVLLFVLGTVLLVVALVLCLTAVLLPLGLVIGFAALWLWALGFRLLLPRKADVQRRLRTRLHVREIRGALSSAARPSKRTRRRTRKRVRAVRRRLGA